MTVLFRRLTPVVTAALALGWAASAHAGRPLATDDAAVADDGTCLLESWGARAGDERAAVLGGGCGVGAGTELDLGAARLWGAGAGELIGSTALKWAGDAARLDTAYGPIAFGAKLGADAHRPVGRDWRLTDLGAWALASWSPREDLAVHLNLGTLYRRETRLSSSTGAVAMAWTPHERVLVFGEVLGHDREAAVRSVGARWWWVPEVLGLDLTAARCAGTGPTTWTFGLGWYGW